MLDRRGLYQPPAGRAEPPRPLPAFFFGAVPMDLDVLDDNPCYLLNLPGHGPIAPMYHRTDHGAFAYARIPSRPDLVFTVEWTTGGIDAGAPLTLEELHDSIHRVMAWIYRCGRPTARDRIGGIGRSASTPGLDEQTL